LMQQLRKVAIIGGCGHVGLPQGIEGLPNFVVNQLRQQQKLRDKVVAVLGMAFKSESDDKRESLSYKLRKLLMLNAIRIESKGGFELSLEVTVKAFLAGYKITETPSKWRDRTAGTSRFRLLKWLPHYLKWYLMAFQPRSRSRGSRKELQPT
jgi:hypothetical protein